MKKNEIRSSVALAVQACEEKKAENLRILQLDQASGAFTDYFVLCTGSNPRQIQAIADEVAFRLKKVGNPPNQIEGYTQAEWCLLDYVDFVVHVFSEQARKYYDLERLWKSAQPISLADLKKAPKVTKKAVAAKTKIAAPRRITPQTSRAKKTTPKKKTAKRPRA